MGVPYSSPTDESQVKNVKRVTEKLRDSTLFKLRKMNAKAEKMVDTKIAVYNHEKDWSQIWKTYFQNQIGEPYEFFDFVKIHYFKR